VRHVNDLSRWEVTLVDGQVIEVWADGYQVLADVDEDQQEDLLILGITPSNPRRVIVGLSRFPRKAVAKIRTG